MNSEIRQRFQEIGNQRETDDPIVIAIFKMHSGESQWFAIEYDEKTNSCFGFSCDLDMNDVDGIWTSFSLDELAEIEHPDFPIQDVVLNESYKGDQCFSALCPGDFHTWERQKEIWEWDALQQCCPELEYDR